jgi:Ca2+-binding EF-hand superfamily protein
MDEQPEAIRMTSHSAAKIDWRQKSAIRSALAAPCAWVLLATSALAASSAGDAALFDRLDSDKNGRVTADEVSPDTKRLFERLLRRGDADGDQTLSREELIASLVPSRPEKTIEARQPATFPQADAVRWLLLTMDTDGNSRIEADEVPEDLRSVFEVMLQRIDNNKNGTLERMELSRGGPPLAQIAGRFTQRQQIDVEAELRKLEKKLGKAASRFDLQRVPLQDLGDPEKAREIFAQLDGNGNGQVEAAEVPEPFRRPLQRLLRVGDRDGNGRLSRREFLAAAKQFAERQARQANRERMRNDAMPADDAMPASEAMRAE